MENKVVCDYCGTIYDGSREKCPLCGSTTRAEAAPTAPRRRLTEAGLLLPEDRKGRVTLENSSDDRRLIDLELWLLDA